MLLEVVLWIGLIFGVISAGTALYGRFFDLPSFFTGPNICKLEAKGCQMLFRTKRASLWGVPNSFLAILFYLAVVAGIAFNVPSWILFCGSCLSMFMSLSLAISLVRNKLECRICWIGHFSNASIWICFMINLLRF